MIPPDDFLPLLEQLMLRELTRAARPGSSPVRFNAKQAWARVDRDLDEVFLSMIGIKP